LYDASFIAHTQQNGAQGLLSCQYVEITVNLQRE